MKFIQNIYNPDTPVNLDKVTHLYLPPPTKHVKEGEERYIYRISFVFGPGEDNYAPWEFTSYWSYLKALEDLGIAFTHSGEDVLSEIAELGV